MQATAAETGASVQNIEQLVKGDYDVAFSLADTAADAVNGSGDFDGEQDVSALGAHLLQLHPGRGPQADSGINSVADFKGKRISTGSPQSGTEVIANRLIEAAGLETADVKAQRLDLTKTDRRHEGRQHRRAVWSGGLPTPAITDLFTVAGQRCRDSRRDRRCCRSCQEINPVYEKGDHPRRDVQDARRRRPIVVPNLLMVRDDMRENLACALTTLVYDKKDVLEQVHPAAADISLDLAAKTDPVPVHPGSERAIEELRTSEHPPHRTAGALRHSTAPDR